MTNCSPGVSSRTGSNRIATTSSVQRSASSASASSCLHRDPHRASFTHRTRQHPCRHPRARNPPSRGARRADQRSAPFLALPPRATTLTSILDDPPIASCPQSTHGTLIWCGASSRCSRPGSRCDALLLIARAGSTEVLVGKMLVGRCRTARRRSGAVDPELEVVDGDHGRLRSHQDSGPRHTSWWWPLVVVAHRRRPARGADGAYRGGRRTRTREASVHALCALAPRDARSSRATFCPGVHDRVRAVRKTTRGRYATMVSAMAAAASARIETRSCAARFASQSANGAWPNR